MKLALRALAFSTLLLLALPSAQASAGTAASKVGGYSTTLLYTAAGGEANDVTISGSGNSFTVHDSAGVTAGADCSQVDAMTATCTDYFTYISVRLKDGNDVVHLQTAVASRLDGGSGDDGLYGGAGKDQLIGGPGSDVLSGGGGPDDSADYSADVNPVTVTLDGVANDGESGEGDDVMPDVEGVVGGSGNDTLTGSVGRDDLGGGPGDDSLSGLGGADYLFGGDGNDHVLGGGGADSLYGAAGDDTMAGGGGNDGLDGNLGNNHLSGGAGDDSLYSDYAGSIDADLCGSGADSAEVDASDTVSSDCESVTVV